VRILIVALAQILACRSTQTSGTTVIAGPSAPPPTTPPPTTPPTTQPPTAPPPAASPLSEGDHTVTVDGHLLAYHVHGRGPICIAHPGGPGLDWSYLRMPEVEVGVTVVYLEPVGTGNSARLATAAEYTKARYVDDLEGVRAAIGLDKLCLVGHSYGGFVAQRYALAHADRLSALVLYDTAARTDAAFVQAVVARAHEFFGTRPWFADAFAAMAAEDSATTDDAITALWPRELPLYFADFDTHAVAYRARFSATVTAAPLHAHDRPFDTRAELPHLHVPTLVVVGRRDFVCSPPFADELHAAIAGSEMVVLEHSGHMGHIEEPQAFAAAVIGFVTAHH
jgi:proline iminopeptidase